MIREVNWKAASKVKIITGLLRQFNLEIDLSEGELKVNKNY